MQNEVFPDTVYAIALASASDEYHEQAASLAYQLKAAPTKLVTTCAVLLELGNALSRQRFRKGAINLLDAFEADSKVEIVPLSEQLYSQALSLYRAGPDKEWGLVDCISFVVMQERGIVETLTTGEHFRQVGFQVLLRKGAE